MLRIVMLLSCLACLSCQGNFLELQRTSDRVALIRSETSFGMCGGYCIRELVIDSAEVRLIVRSHFPQTYPTRTYTRTLSPDDWRRLNDAIDRDVFTRLDSVYGCPDCADGGAELMELDWGGERRRVTFEFRNPPRDIRALHERIWQIRSRFDDVK
jgi:hypothetical protein